MIIVFLIYLSYSVRATHVNELIKICANYKQAPNLDIRDLVGMWMTVYTQPDTVNCFNVNIRMTTELEREQLSVKYGNFSNRVNWSICFLQVESVHGKHFLQGNGSNSGIFENVVIEDREDKYELQQQDSDQWTIFGRRGAELLLMKDCAGKALAMFARAPYWPEATDIYAILHRSSVQPMTRQRILCEPMKNCYFNNMHLSRKKSGKLDYNP